MRIKRRMQPEHKIKLPCINSCIHFLTLSNFHAQKMKSSTVQTPQKAAIRRSKEKSHKIIAKSLNPAFLAASEADPLHSSFISAITEGNQETDLSKSGPKPSFSSPSDAFDSTDALESFSTPLIADGNQGSGGSEVFKTENVYVQVAIDLLLAARFQVLNSPNVDLQWKKLLDCLIKSAIEPLDWLPEEQDRFYGLLQEKVWIGLLRVFVWIISVSVIMDRDARTGTGFPGMRLLHDGF
ncbi:uncharacterized protein LOC131226889 [Magnolia sinica]|uniref:uncharacterized protein LOC131226889 n=1 Tax=Magnolia sinica TaxID=86752 RepID=UPI00265B4804|nr:uncharacterized protein LOC131226889 [Magnolia sinica]